MAVTNYLGTKWPKYNITRVQNDQVSYELVYSTVAVYDKWQTNPLNLIYFISIYIRKYQVTFKEMKHFDIHNDEHVAT